MIDGMRMDLVKSRYKTFDELYEYCYRVAGTVALMSVPVMGIDPKYKVTAGLDACIFLVVSGSHNRKGPLFQATFRQCG